MAEFALPTRSGLVDRWLRYYKIRNPGAAVDTDTIPYAEACCFADTVLPAYAALPAAAKSGFIQFADEAGLINWGQTLNLPRRGATPSTGSIRIAANSNGGTIALGAELVEPNRNIKFNVTSATGTRQNKETITVQSAETGPLVNLPTGTMLQFSSPPPGIESIAITTTGLTGGRDVESIESWRQRLIYYHANQPVPFNDAYLQLTADSTPEVPIEKSFTYPAARGPGTSTVLFTVYPAKPGGSKAPTPIQIGKVQAAILAVFPTDNGVAMGYLREVPQNVVLRVTLTPSQTWKDGLQCWPLAANMTSSGVVTPILVTAVTSASSFTVGPVTASTQAPIVGQTIALWNDGHYYKKQITSVSASGSNYVLGTSTSIGDVAFTPVAALTSVGPWTDALGSFGPQVLAYFDSVGPGEMRAAASPLYDRRGQRSPDVSFGFPNSVVSAALLQRINGLGITTSASLYYFTDGLAQEVNGFQAKIPLLSTLTIIP